MPPRLVMDPNREGPTLYAVSHVGIDAEFQWEQSPRLGRNGCLDRVRIHHGNPGGLSSRMPESHLVSCEERDLHQYGEHCNKEREKQDELDRRLASLVVSLRHDR